MSPKNQSETVPQEQPSPQQLSKAEYQKFCKFCKKPFSSSARNTKYCSDDCLDKAREIMAGRGKRRANYQRNKTELRAQSMSRKTAREKAINLLAKHWCERCKKAFPIEKIECHHIDANPHNNPDDGSNWSLLCEPCHHAAQAELQVIQRDGKGWYYEQGIYYDRPVGTALVGPRYA